MSLSKRLLFVGCVGILSVLTACGCDSGGTTGLSGKVTLDGQPVKNGFIAFYPEGSEGKETSTKIEDGEYKVKNVTLGKNKVRVTITQQMEPAAPRSEKKNREAANAERLGQRKSQPARTNAPLNIADNDQVKDIDAGTSQLDIALNTRR